MREIAFVGLGRKKAMSVTDRVLGAPWVSRDEPELTRETLDALFANRIPCIRVRGFATVAECRAFVAAMDAVGLNKAYQVASPSVRSVPRYIGVPQFEYRKKSKAAYFAEVESSYADQVKVFAHCGFDPVRRLIDRVHAVVPELPIGIAQEPGHGRYFAGIIRETTGGTNLHMDFARFSAPDYAIGANSAQIATNFYASGTAAGGETTVYNHHFVPTVPAGTYYEISPLDPARVAASESYTFAPAAGDLVMFNSRNPHRVHFNPNNDGTRRMGIGSFIGRRPEGDLVLWS
jgi:hypothetical protein